MPDAPLFHPFTLALMDELATGRFEGAFDRALAKTDAAKPEARDPRDPDPTRPAPFGYHNCARCKDGRNPCVRGNPAGCYWLSARND